MFLQGGKQKDFKAISALAMQHAPIDIYTVAQELKKTDDLEEIGVLTISLN